MQYNVITLLRRCFLVGSKLDTTEVQALESEFREKRFTSNNSTNHLCKDKWHIESFSLFVIPLPSSRDSLVAVVRSQFCLIKRKRNESLELMLPVDPGLRCRECENH
jgi:hypothetical protein